MRPEALARFERAVEARPDYGEAHNNMGVVLDYLGRFTEALEHYRQAVAINPDSFMAHSNLGVALLRSGATDKGIDALRDAQQLKPTDVAVLDRLAVAYASIERFDVAARYARDAFERALAAGNKALAQSLRARLEEYQLLAR